MKKNWIYVALTMICIVGFTACSKEDNGDDGGNTPTEKLRIKKMTFEYDWGGNPGFTAWSYEYDAQGRVTKVVEAGEDWSEDFVFDWSVAGQVSIVREEASKTKTLMLNEKGCVSKFVNIWGDGGDVTFDYDANGYMIKAYEVYNNTPELKSTFTIKDGNVLSFTRVDRTKAFTYSTGENTGGIFQATNDSFINDWQAHTGLFGKPSKNLNTKVKWSDKDDVSEVSFEFYDDGSVKKVIRSGSDWYENYVYEYEVIK